MFGRTHDRPAREQPVVARIEAILGEPSSELGDALRRGRVLAAARAVWICPCSVVTDTDVDAPTWLVVDAAGAAGAAWSRVPVGVEPTDVVVTSDWCGGHTDPESVLEWLQGRVSDPWGGGDAGFGDSTTLTELRTQIVSRE